MTPLICSSHPRTQHSLRHGKPKRRVQVARRMASWQSAHAGKPSMLQEMTLDEYEKLFAEKRANLNKPAAKATAVDPKAFEGMKAYTRKVLPALLLLLTRVWH
jgi:hypothetical protein